MSGWINKILYGGLAIISAICIFLYISNNSMEKDIIKKNSQISSLKDERDSYRKRWETSEELRSELDEVIQDTRESLKALDNKKKNTLSQIEEIKSRGMNSEEQKKEVGSISNDNLLDNDLIGLLDELCESVRGEECPDP